MDKYAIWRNDEPLSVITEGEYELIVEALKGLRQSYKTRASLARFPTIPERKYQEYATLLHKLGK